MQTTLSVTVPRAIIVTAHTGHLFCQLSGRKEKNTSQTNRFFSRICRKGVFTCSMKFYDFLILQHHSQSICNRWLPAHPMLPLSQLSRSAPWHHGARCCILHHDVRNPSVPKHRAIHRHNQGQLFDDS